MSSIVVRGAEEIKRKLEKLGNTSTYKPALVQIVLILERELKEKVPTDRGIMRNSISSNVSGMTGKVRINAEHGIYQNYGFTVRNGRIFFDRKSGTFKRIKATRFIQGKHFVEKAIADKKGEIVEEIRKVVIDI